MFELFDPKQDVAKWRGKLPHWYQPGVTYFVTFRTADSIPGALLKQWHAERDDWLQRHGIEKGRDWKSQLRSEPQLERAFHARFTRQFMDYLDRGHGACPLVHREAAEIVRDALDHFDEDRYLLADYVVMPNHIHVLFCLLGDTDLIAQCESWKRFSASQINALLKLRGRFWQAESFDHLVRTEEHFHYFRQYVADNPRRAGLRAGEYLHWSRQV